MWEQPGTNDSPLNQRVFFTVAALKQAVAI